MKILLLEDDLDLCDLIISLSRTLEERADPFWL